jgi:aubergine
MFSTGKDGTEVKLASNYFEITSAPDIMMYQYHVDYIPVLDDTRLQKALLREHEKTIGKYIFTGTEMFTPARLPQPYELTSRRRSDDEPIRIIIRLVKEVHPADDMYIQIMNIIMRRCLEMLDLVEIRRDFFDKEAAKRVNVGFLNIFIDNSILIQFIPL